MIRALLWDLFPPPLEDVLSGRSRPVVGATAAASRVVSEKVKAIEAHLQALDQELAREPREIYNLVDWDADDPRLGIRGPVYLGSALALTDHTFIKNHIGAVVTIIDDRCPKKMIRQELGPNIKLLYLPLDDAVGEDISQYFQRVSDFIRDHQKRNIPVLVHCMAGMSRSSTLVAYFLMQKYGWSALKALDWLKRQRPIVRPNRGFIRKLVEAEK